MVLSEGNKDADPCCEWGMCHLQVENFFPHIQTVPSFNDTKACECDNVLAGIGALCLNLGAQATEFVPKGGSQSINPSDEGVSHAALLLQKYVARRVSYHRASRGISTVD
eukprot:3085618-Amphidinium_carterae.1